MNHYVLVRKGQEAVTGKMAADQVVAHGFVKAAAEFGVGASTLRKFLHDEGFRFARHTSWQVEPLPGLEDEPDVADDGGADVQAPSAGAPEPAGAGA